MTVERTNKMQENMEKRRLEKIRERDDIVASIPATEGDIGTARWYTWDSSNRDNSKVSEIASHDVATLQFFTDQVTENLREYARLLINADDYKLSPDRRTQLTNSIALEKAKLEYIRPALEQKAQRREHATRLIDEAPATALADGDMNALRERVAQMIDETGDMEGRWRFAADIVERDLLRVAEDFLQASESPEANPEQLAALRQQVGLEKAKRDFCLASLAEVEGAPDKQAIAQLKESIE